MIILLSILFLLILFLSLVVDNAQLRKYGWKPVWTLFPIPKGRFRAAFTDSVPFKIGGMILGALKQLSVSSQAEKLSNQVEVIEDKGAKFSELEAEIRSAVDPIAEAEFHSAYGLYDRAANLLKEALQAEPQNTQLRLKLLETLFVWEDRDRFVEEAQVLHNLIGQRPDSNWHRVLIMGRQLAPEEPLFWKGEFSAGELEVVLADVLSDTQKRRRLISGDEKNISLITEVMRDQVWLVIDEIGTKLVLARAYFDMGDPDGAQHILEEMFGTDGPALKTSRSEVISRI